MEQFMNFTGVLILIVFGSIVNATTQYQASNPGDFTWFDGIAAVIMALFSGLIFVVVALAIADKIDALIGVSAEQKALQHIYYSLIAGGMGSFFSIKGLTWVTTFLGRKGGVTNGK